MTDPYVNGRLMLTNLGFFLMVNVDPYMAYIRIRHGGYHKIQGVFPRGFCRMKSSSSDSHTDERNNFRRMKTRFLTVTPSCDKPDDSWKKRLIILKCMWQIRIWNCRSYGSVRLHFGLWLVVWLPFFIVPYIGNNHPNWLIFFRGVQTTNQVFSLLQKNKWIALQRPNVLSGHYVQWICRWFNPPKTKNSDLERQNFGWTTTGGMWRLVWGFPTKHIVDMNIVNGITPILMVSHCMQMYIRDPIRNP